MAVRTAAGRALRERLETSLFDRLPGYALVRSLTQRLAGNAEEHTWRPALAEIREEALVPRSLFEVLEDGRFTVSFACQPTVRPCTKG